jgi:hypothetical protein
LEVSGQHYTPTILTLRKEPLRLIGQGT